MKAKSGVHHGVIAILLVVTAATSCRQDRRLKVTGEPPALSPLKFLLSISSRQHTVTGVTADSNCVILLATATGEMVRVQLDEKPLVARTLSLSSSGIVFGRLEGSAGRGLIWSMAANRIAPVSPDGELGSEVELPDHPWLGRVAGPAVISREGTLVVAPLGARPEVAAPRPWIPVPLIWALRRSGEWIEIGRLRDAGGVFKSAFAGQLRVGIVRDTVLAISLVDATLSSWSVDATFAMLENTVSLPKYYRQPTISEEIWNPPWIQIGGSLPRVYAAPALAEATFDVDGNLYAVRNHDFRWHPDQSALAQQYYSDAGTWIPRSKWLEVFTGAGEMLGAFSFRTKSPNWVRVGANGHLFVQEEGQLNVYEDPLRSRASCGTYTQG